MSKKSDKKFIWPTGSCVSVFAFFNLSTYVGLAQIELNFPTYAVMIIANVVIIPSVLLFLDRSGYGEDLWSFWKSIPLFIHKGICFLCLFWISFISLKGLIPAIKKDYERN